MGMWPSPNPNLIVIKEIKLYKLIYIYYTTLKNNYIFI